MARAKRYALEQAALRENRSGDGHGGDESDGRGGWGGGGGAARQHQGGPDLGGYVVRRPQAPTALQAAAEGGGSAEGGRGEATGMRAAAAPLRLGHDGFFDQITQATLQ